MVFEKRRLTYSAIIALGVCLWLCCSLSDIGVNAMQTPIWQDTFNDGTYAPEWTVFEGTFSAATLRLECGPDVWNFACHDSTVATGEWRFDVYINAPMGIDVAFIATDTNGVGLLCPRTCYLLRFAPTEGWIRLYRRVSGSSSLMGTYTTGINLGTLYHIIVTRDSSGHFKVWIDDVLQIEADSTHIETSSHFVVRITESGYIDNVRVYDQILTNGDDSDGNGGNGGTTIWGLPINPIMIGIAVGVVAAVIIVVVLIFVRRRKGPG